MPSLVQILLIAPAILVVAHGQGVILSAQGTSGSPASLPLQVDTTQADANIINENEISTNVVNECGRTLLGGNIDIGENTENQLAAKTVTSVTKGSTVDVTISQGSADGAGPYTCDMDFTSNADGVSGQTNLTVKENDSSNGNIALSLTMPSDMVCVGASTGNVCTVRCFNNAAAGPFGSCFAVQQTDIKANKNSADTISTAQTLAGIQAQVLQNQLDLPAAVQAIASAGSTAEAKQGVALVDSLLKIDSTASAVVQIAAVSSTASAKSTSKTNAASANAVTSKGGKGNKGGNKARAFIA